MFLPDFIVKDWTRKLVAFFFAVLIWYVVNQQLHEYATFREIPVKVDTESGFTVINKGTQFVTVKVRGPLSRLKNMSSQEIKISVYVPSPEKSGQIQYPVSSESISLPHGVAVDQVIPERISIDIDRIEKKEVPVRVVTSGKLDASLQEIEEARSVIPQKVYVTGPSRLLADIESVQTEPEFFDSKVIGSYEKTVKVSKQVPSVSASPEKVTVSFKIEEISGEEVFRDLPVCLLQNEKETNLRLVKTIPALDQITLMGPKDELKKINLGKIKAFIDISGISEPGRHKMPVNVWLGNPKVKMIFVSPSSIDIEMEIKTEDKEDVKLPEPAIDPKLKEIEDENNLLIIKEEPKEELPKLEDVENESNLLIEQE